ncbi:hypothetical protein IE53DRAFT_383139 [Violaceomyces palustris]|uniref:Uncharacterized protein n=1 Tax=Violaceomyces palustris TaxID=1673888 RepID=A0ACD0P843_9BASI|nr:hypothetical protein IE53DRAFT_383139 [Violaceomyces palustris]
MAQDRSFLLLSSFLFIYASSLPSLSRPSFIRPNSQTRSAPRKGPGGSPSDEKKVHIHLRSRNEFENKKGDAFPTLEESPHPDLRNEMDAKKGKGSKVQR